MKALILLITLFTYIYVANIFIQKLTWKRGISTFQYTILVTLIVTSMIAILASGLTIMHILKELIIYHQKTEWD